MGRSAWRPASLRSGVAWSATLVVAAWLVVLAAVAVLVVGIALGRTADDSLRTRAQAVAATVVVAADGGVTQLESPDDQALDTDTWIVDGAGGLVEGPTADSSLPPSVAAVARRALASRAEEVQTADADDPTRLLALPVPAADGERAGGAAAVVVTATSLVPYRQLRDLTVAGVVVLGLLLVAGVHLVLRVSLSRALSPVEQMSALVQRWSTDDPSQRLGAAPRPLELRALAATLDGLLDRIDAALRHERLLTAELSHELRTPLAGVKAELDWLRAPQRTPAERAAAHEELDAAVARMERVIGELLASARSATAAPGRCDVAAAVGRVVAVGRGRDVPVHVDVEPGLTAGVEAPVLERALSPLVDNALRFASGRVRVRARRDGGRVVLAVHDDGPGVPADLVARVLEPGFRADPLAAHDGSGLGLALSLRLARTAGGDVVVSPAGEAGGGLVTLVLPAG